MNTHTAMGTSASSLPEAAADVDLQRFPDVKGSKILIVDDEPMNVKVVATFLRLDGYQNVMTTTDPGQVLDLVEREEPDVILLDIMMPRISGLDLLAALRADGRWTHLPVVILTAASDAEIKRKALQLGASDFLTKPLDRSDLLPRVRNVLTVKQHYDSLRTYSQQLEEAVLRRTAELARSRQEVIHCLARAGEFRDDHTGKHVWRVGRYARLIAAQLGWRGEQLEMLEQAAQLHDIGKIGIPDAILLKPGKLSGEEFALMKRHSIYGQQIMFTLPKHDQNQLADNAELGPNVLEATESPVLALAGRIAATHHERWDGTGYPLGLAGEAIPIEGRITAVADVFDALSTRRPYKPAYQLDQCFSTLEEGRGTHFDPTVLDAFFRAVNDIVRVYLEHADGA